MDIKPTRSELIKLKKRIALAKAGYKLLKKKRDGLILEFFEILKKTKSLREEMTVKYIEATEKITLARVHESDLTVKSIALAVKDRPEIELQQKNIMGVIVPRIKTKTEIEKDMTKKGFGIASTSIAISQAAESYSELLEYVIMSAEVETSLKRLLTEIEKTKRRVNALEFEVIPKLVKLQSFITLRLEEQERETIFRTKRIKGKR